MAKKSKKKNLRIIDEIIGLCLITASILLFFSIGVVSKYINAFLFYLFGNMVYIFLMFIFYIGVLFLINRHKSNLSLVRKIAIGLFLVSVIVFSSLIGFDSNISFSDYADGVWNSIVVYLNDDSKFNDFGGGIFGYLITKLFVNLFTVVGTIIIFIVIIIIASLLLFQKSLSSYFGGRTKKPKKEKAVKEEVKVVEKKKEPKIYNFDDEVEPIISTHQDEILVEKVEEVEVIKSGGSGKYHLPSSKFLTDNSKPYVESKDILNDKANILIRTLNEFGVSGKVVAINTGPTVTQYELEISAGTKLSKITSLSSEIALALAAKDVRIQAPIPSKSTVGIEIPNDKFSMVSLKQILSSISHNESDKTIVGLGKDIMGKPIYCSLRKMPHLLVAGATGSGKSVCINSIIISLVMRAKPSEVKMLMIDPKKVELSGYNGLPHLLAPVVTNPKKAAAALQKIVVEMERRYDLLSDNGCKNIEGYNEKMVKAGYKNEVLPYIIVIVDELADLMLVASKEVEDAIMRITQMARAAGIHLIIATQRPSTDVITGVIKANIPSRIAFGVSSSIDSRTILDSMGAEKLLGKGDMLYLPMGENYPIRIQGAYVSESDVEDIVNYCAKQQIAQFDEELVKLDSVDNSNTSSEDDLYGEVLEFVLEQKSVSVSLIQRRFRIGYNRASRLIDDLEANGVISGANGSKPREVIVGSE